MIQKAFTIHKTLLTKPIRDNFYFHYLTKLYIGFMVQGVYLSEGSAVQATL